MNSDKAVINIARAGEFFMYCLWIQGQMADLIILRKNPNLVEPFVATPKKLPKEMVLVRIKYWEKQFKEVKREFETLFAGEIEEQHQKDLDAIYCLRNAIAHSHVSIGRDFLLYRPSRGEKQEVDILMALELQEVEDACEPRMLSIRLYDDQRYLADFNRIKRLDESCFSAIAAGLGIPHGRIR